jgi:hypothetical protein
MIWATTVGVDGGGQWAKMCAMMWAMMCATGMMAVTMPVRMPAKGMAGTTAAAAAGGAPGGGCGGGGSNCSGNSCILLRLFPFYCEDIFLWCFHVLGEGHTPPHTLVMLEVCRRTFGWGWKLSSINVVCKYQTLSIRKACQSKLVVFYTKVLRTKNEL